MSGGQQRMSLVVMGAGGVGKSAITLSFMRNQFVEEYDPTIEDSYCKECLIDGVETTLDITDTAGQEEYRGLWSDKFIREADGFLLVYSITSRESFGELSSFRDHILRAREGMKCPLIILGNKKDLERYREVSAEEGKRFAQNSGALFMETSAKEHPSVEKGFYDMVREVRRFRGQKQAPNNRSSAVSAPSNRASSKPPPKKSKKKNNDGCCIIS